MGAKLKTIAKCAGIYSLWIPKLLVPSMFRSFPGFHPKFKKYLRKIDSRTKKLARTLFWQMIVQGPKLEMRQLILARLVDIGTELAVAGLAISRVQGELNRQNSRNFETVLYWLHSAMIRIDGLFKEVGTNSDKAGGRQAGQAAYG